MCNSIRDRLEIWYWPFIFYWIRRIWWNNRRCSMLENSLKFKLWHTLESRHSSWWICNIKDTKIDFMIYRKCPQHRSILSVNTFQKYCNTICNTEMKMYCNIAILQYCISKKSIAILQYFNTFYRKETYYSQVWFYKFRKYLRIYWKTLTVDPGADV